MHIRIRKHLLLKSFFLQFFFVASVSRLDEKCLTLFVYPYLLMFVLAGREGWPRYTGFLLLLERNPEKNVLGKYAKNIAH